MRDREWLGLLLVEDTVGIAITGTGIRGGRPGQDPASDPSLPERSPDP